MNTIKEGLKDIVEYCGGSMNKWTLMFVSYNDVQKGQLTARNTKVLKLMLLLSRYLQLNITL